MRKSILVQAFLILVISGSQAMAQGSGSSRVQRQGSGSGRAAPPSSSGSSRVKPAVPATPRPPTVAQFAASFWNYLSSPKTSYRRWGTPGKTTPQGGQPGPDGVTKQTGTPHHKVGQTYLNSIANRDLQKLPLNSVLVREEYAADGRTLEKLTVMYRSKGADPKNGDWYWIMYQPNGSLARTPADQGSREIAGRVQSCVACHQRAGGKDLVFLNDRPTPGMSAPQAAPRGNGAVPRGSGSAPRGSEPVPRGSGSRR